MIARYTEWLVRSRNRSAATVRAYSGSLRRWCDYTNGNVLGASLRRMELFVTRPKLDGTERAPASVVLEVNVLRAFYQWCWEQGWAGEHLARALHGPKIPHRDPKPISDGDWKRIWTQEMPARTRVVFGLAYFCGLRRHELWQLRTDQLTGVSVQNFIRKGGGEHSHRWDQVLALYTRSALLSPLLLDHRLFTDAVAEVRSSDIPWVCANRARQRSVESFNPWWKHQLPEGVHVTPHQARHSCATNLVRAGLPTPLVMRYMNHTSPEVTMRYVRAAGSEFDEWLAQTDPIIQKGWKVDSKKLPD